MREPLLTSDEEGTDILGLGRCSVSFHNHGHPIVPTTRLHIPHVPDRHARPRELLVATADPGPLLVDALTRIKEEHSSDPALATIDDHDDSNVESVWLLYWVVHLIPEALGDTRKTLEIRLEIPSTISQREGEADPEEDSPAISLTEDALRDLSGWLRDVSTALENHLKRLQSHNGPISLRQSFRNRAAAFGYFAEHLLSYVSPSFGTARGRSVDERTRAAQTRNSFRSSLASGRRDPFLDVAYNGIQAWSSLRRC